MSRTYLDKMGRYRTMSLFLETNYGNTDPLLEPIYTLKEREHKGLISARKLYVSMMDPTEYKFAKAFLNSWGHWKKLCEADWFQPHLEAWREELEVKMRSLAVAQIQLAAEGESAAAVSAAKYIADKGWDKRSSGPKRGRPTKEDVAHERKIRADMEDEVDQAMKRINKVH